MINLETGARQALGNVDSMSASPRFSPDGRRLVMSVQQGGNADIVTMDIATKAQHSVTNGMAIDTSPTYAPDGSQIAFESDRGGSQQVYVMGADGSNPHRITFGAGSASQPAWSPRGDLIAYTRQRNGGFAICVSKPDGTGERVLTEGYHNEGPTFAPNGQYVLFFRDPGGQGAASCSWSTSPARWSSRSRPLLRLRPDLVAAARGPLSLWGSWSPATSRAPFVEGQCSERGVLSMRQSYRLSH